MRIWVIAMTVCVLSGTTHRTMVTGGRSFVAVSTTKQQVSVTPHKPLTRPEEAVMEFFAAWNTRDRGRLLRVLSSARKPNAPTRLTNVRSAQVIVVQETANGPWLIADWGY